MGEQTNSRVRITMAATGVVGALLLAGCSSGGSSDDSLPPEPTATATLADTTPVADGTTIAARGWGVVKYETVNDGEQVFALRVTDVTRGQPGDFSEMQDLSGGDLSSPTAVPWWIDYDWVRISGTTSWSPTQVIGLAAKDEADQAGVSTLSVPAEYIHCQARETDSSVGVAGLVQHGCVTGTTPKGLRPGALGMTSIAPGTQDVRWTLPAGGTVH